MAHAISLALVLYGLWLLLSGHYEPLLLGFGVLSCALVVAIALRMDVVDKEGHPVHLGWRALAYWPWLLLEIAKSNIDVARRVLHPALPISPTLVRVKASQSSDLGQVIYANSITLTPGTVSIELEDGMIDVHALTGETAAALEAGEMNRRILAMMGEA
ncbi:MAG: Na+/H+ antiporter subunit E [Dongiaceae bacterium]